MIKTNTIVVLKIQLWLQLEKIKGYKIFDRKKDENNFSRLSIMDYNKTHFNMKL